MGRILAKGNYTSDGGYEFRVVEPVYVMVGEKEEEIFKKGEVFVILRPNKIFGIGTSIGGYWVKPITYAGQKMLAVIRISGSERKLPLWKLRKKVGSRKGLILKPGMIGLWATSAGSARRGIFHRYTPPKDEVEKALDRATNIGPGRKCLHRVEKIDVEIKIGREDCYCSYEKYLVDYDGKFFFDNRGKRIKGGTYLLQWYAQRRNGGWSPSLMGAYITPKADQKEVARLIKTGPFRRS